MKIFLGADHQGFYLKEKVFAYLAKHGYEVEDVGNHELDPHDDFPEFAQLAATRVVGETDRDPRAILLCGGAQGMASDIEIQAREILRIRRRMNELYVKYTGKSLEEIERAMDRDTFLEAEEAKAFGLVDQVFEKRPVGAEAAAAAPGADKPAT